MSMMKTFLVLALLALCACFAAAQPCTLRLVTLGQDQLTATLQNVAPGATVIASNQVGSTSVINDRAYHTSVSLNQFATTGYLGYTFASDISVAQIGWSADNAPGAGVVAPQLSYEGLFQIQITTTDLNNNWVTIAQTTYDFKLDPNGNFRHVYSIDCGTDAVAISRLSRVRGIRIVAQGGAAFDEIEVYSTATVAATGTNAGAQAGLVQTGGTFYTGNLATSATTASGTGFLKNGLYGDPALLLGTAPLVQDHAYFTFPGATAVTHVAFGRDNSGYYRDALGTYIIQVSESALSGDATTGWVTVGVVNNFGSTLLPNNTLRHVFQFQNARTGQFGLTGVFGVRILTPFRTQSQLDEVEIYNFAVPTGSSAFVGSFTNTTLYSGVATPGGKVAVASGTPLGFPTGVYVSTSSAGVVFSPNPVSIAFNESSGTFLTTCNAIGPVTVSFGTAQSPAFYGTALAYCYGTLRYYTTAPTAVLRGQSFTLNLELVPAPLQATEFVVRTSSRWVVPSTERAYFGIGQTRTSVRFDVLVDSPVGDVNIEFRSRSVRLYQPLVSTIRVLGTIGTSLANPATLPFRITSQQTVTVVPPVTPQLSIDNANNTHNLFSYPVTVNATGWAQLSTNTLMFASGQESASFTIFPVALGTFTLTLSSPYHQQLNVTVTVLGSLFASTPSVLYIGRQEHFELSAEPAPTSPLLVTISATNGLQVAPNATVPTLVPAVQLSLVSGSTTFPGPASISFSAAGYFTFTTPITVTDKAACPAGFSLAGDDTTCAKCPINQAGSTCSGGPCVPSSFDATEVRCVCPANIAGRACEYGREVRYEYATFTNNGTQLSATPSPADSRAIIAFYRIPQFLLPLNNDPLFGGKGQVVIESPSVSGTFVSSLPWTVVANTPLPVESNARFEIPNTNFASGFVIDIMTEDNTPIDQFPKPVEVFYYPDLRIAADYHLLVLYYWNAATSQWIRAQNTCPSPQPQVIDRVNSPINIDLNHGNVYAQICRAGQYAFFQRTPIFTQVPVVPSAPHPLPPPTIHSDPRPDIGEQLAGTTGQTGLQAPVPVLPDFPDQDAQFDPEPLRLALGSVSAAANLAASSVLVLLVTLALMAL